MPEINIPISSVSDCHQVIYASVVVGDYSAYFTSDSGICAIYITQPKTYMETAFLLKLGGYVDSWCIELVVACTT